MAPAEPGRLRVEVVFAPAPRTARVLSLELPAGSVVGQAVQQALEHLGLAGTALPDGLVAAVWGRVADPDAPLRDRDRVELLRALQVDPKEARRLRYRSQGGRSGRPRR